MESVVGGADSAGDENPTEELTAGIELEVLGSAVRPYTFFSGQGELMGLVWSGTGSEVTQILKVSTLFCLNNLLSNLAK